MDQKAGTQQHIIKNNSQCGYEINASWAVHSRLLCLHSTLCWTREAFRSRGEDERELTNIEKAWHATLLISSGSARSHASGHNLKQSRTFEESMCTESLGRVELAVREMWELTRVVVCEWLS
jgi:hypothetical protein